jgi:hypothetical protein
MDKIALNDPAWKTVAASYGAVDVSSEFARGMSDYVSHPTAYADTPEEGVREQLHHITSDLAEVIGNLHHVLRTADKPDVAVMALKAVVTDLGPIAKKFGVLSSMHQSLERK